MSANFRILVVDDDEDTAFAVGKALEALGYTVDAFADPEDALSSFKSGLYDLVLLDVLMKKTNGFDLYERLIAIDTSLRVCFMTGLNFRHLEGFQKIRAKVPADCFLEKPFHISSISKIIRRELQQKNNHSS